jgi:hypothetical protein
VVGISQDDREKIYSFIQPYTSGITLDEIAKQYCISPKDPRVLLAIAELLADGKLKTEMRGEKLYCMVVELGTLGGKKDATI